VESASEPVTLVTDQPPLSGIGVYVTRLHDLLLPSFPGIEVRNLHYFRYPETPPHQPVPGQRYASSRLRALGALRQNERTFGAELEGRRRLVHLCGASYDLATRLDRPLATVHDFGLRTFGSLWNTRSDLLLVEAYSLVDWLRTPRYLKRCRRIVVPSQYTAARLAGWTGLDSVVIPHWIDGERFRPRSKTECRTRLGLPPDRKIVLSVSSGAAYKNLELLRRVVDLLPPEYLLVKVGYPLPGLAGKVRNVGPVPDEQYPLYFDAADAYLHVSVREGFGIPLLEAMSSGTPVVALANPPSPEVLGEAARLVPPGAPPVEVAGAVRGAVESPEAAARLAAAGVARARRFDASGARSAYTEVYLNAMRA